VASASFSPDGQRIASIAGDGSARVWNAVDGRPLLALADPGLARERAVVLGNEHALLPFASAWRLYAVVGARLVAELPVEAPLAALISDDGKSILTVGAAASGGLVRLWDGASGRPLALLQQAPACLSMGGGRILAAGDDGDLRIWEFDRDPAAAPAAAGRALVDRARQELPRCLTRAERERARLAVEPPDWCIEMAKWPYQAPEWRDWLRYRRAQARPPLPDTPEWRAWAAARADGTHASPPAAR
jgi:hypothetical protein